jgi:hypothetical protein
MVASKHVKSVLSSVIICNGVLCVRIDVKPTMSVKSTVADVYILGGNVLAGLEQSRYRWWPELNQPLVDARTAIDLVQQVIRRCASAKAAVCLSTRSSKSFAYLFIIFIMPPTTDQWFVLQSRCIK